MQKTNPRSSESIFCQYLNHSHSSTQENILTTENISDSENILMDSSVYKTMNGLSAFYPQNSERESEKNSGLSVFD